MYFGGIDGYTYFYPSEIKLDSTPPRVLISGFNIPGKEKRSIYFDDIDTDKKVELKYYENSFTVNFTGLHYVNPLKNTFSYMLEGYQDDWIYSGSLNSVNFSQLPPGDYTLRVKAANSDGIYNETGDTLLISISSPFWHTAWFYAIILVSIGLILYGLHRYRLSLKMQQVLAIDKIRKETAEDFHDELGHKLTTISWFGEIVRSKLKPENDDAKIYIDKIVETSQQMYHTMKDLLWAMDPEKDTVNDLYTQIKEFGEDLFDRTGIEFNSESNVDLKGNKILPLHHKRQVILIFKEIMHNTLKHSGANKADFKLAKSNGQIHFRFLDNGKGYTLNGHPTGFGLKNVKRRSELLHADLKIASTGSGTSVDLSFNSN
jgi:two-component sensor histidine kinase